MGPAAFHISTGEHPGAAPCGGGDRADHQLRGFRELTQLYLSGAISFASVMAGLCTGAGVGLIVLFKMNESRRENLKLLGLLVATGMAAGMALELLKF